MPDGGPTMPPDAGSPGSSPVVVESCAMVDCPSLFVDVMGMCSDTDRMCKESYVSEDPEVLVQCFPNGVKKVMTSDDEGDCETWKVTKPGGAPCYTLEVGFNEDEDIYIFKSPTGQELGRGRTETTPSSSPAPRTGRSTTSPTRTAPASRNRCAPKTPPVNDRRAISARPIEGIEAGCSCVLRNLLQNHCPTSDTMRTSHARAGSAPAAHVARLPGRGAIAAALESRRAPTDWGGKAIGPVAALCLGVFAAGPVRAAPDTAALQLALELPEMARVVLPHVELRLGAAPPDWLRLGQFDLGPPRVGLTLEASHLDLRVTAGRQLARDGSTGVSLAAHLRLGARDGVNLTARYGYLVGRDRALAHADSGSLGPHGTINIPLATRLALTAEGTFLGDHAALATIGLTRPMVGDGGPSSWAVTGGLGLAFQRTAPGCGGARLCFKEWQASPAAIFGIEGRF